MALKNKKKQAKELAEQVNEIKGQMDDIKKILEMKLENQSTDGIQD